MLLFFASCESKVEINDAAIIGKWKLMSVVATAEAGKIGSAQVVSVADETYFYEFTKDHELYYTWEEERIYHHNAGSWSLWKNLLTTEEWGIATVDELTSTKMVLQITETNGSEQLEAVMEFKRLN